MDDNVYRVIEVVGSSSDNLEDAIRQGIKRAGENLSNLGWFNVKEIRGHIEDGDIGHFQVTMKVGFRIED